MVLDKRAVRILAETFWSATGWKRDPVVPPDDFAYAKSHGVMFDPISRSHGQTIAEALEAVSAIDQNAVSQAFVASLSSRRLDLRSALASYAVGRNLRAHELIHSDGFRFCACCGTYDKSEIDLNILNFERIKWGGVRHDQPAYIAFDLQVFGVTERAEPQEQDLAILRSVLDVAGSMSSKARLSDLDKALAKLLPSSSAERRTLISILGFAGILVDRNRPDFRQKFVSFVERERTPWHTDDWPYPVQWWTGAHGVNEPAIKEWFGFV